MEAHHDNLTYLEEPYLIKDLPLKFNKEIINYTAALPKHIQAVEAHFLVFLHTGGGNKDALFRICIKDTQGPCRKWVLGHGYGQNAWSYNSETISMPVNTARELEISLDNKQTGNAGLKVYLVAFR